MALLAPAGGCATSAHTNIGSTEQVSRLAKISSLHRWLMSANVLNILCSTVSQFDDINWWRNSYHVASSCKSHWGEWEQTAPSRYLLVLMWCKTVVTLIRAEAYLPHADERETASQNSFTVSAVNAHVTRRLKQNTRRALCSLLKVLRTVTDL